MPAASVDLPFLPLPEDKADLLARLIEGLEAPALHWLSGYTAGLATQSAGPSRAVATLQREPSPQQRLTIVYGSQSGNAKRVAEQLTRNAEGAGLAVRLLRADAYPTRELQSERLLAIVIRFFGAFRHRALQGFAGHPGLARTGCRAADAGRLYGRRWT